LRSRRGRGYLDTQVADRRGCERYSRIGDERRVGPTASASLVCGAVIVLVA
jgi:hypothetical protein